MSPSLFQAYLSLLKAPSSNIEFFILHLNYVLTFFCQVNKGSRVQFAAYFSCITTCLHLYWWKMCCKLLKNRADETLFRIVDIFQPCLRHLPSVIFRFPKNLGNILYPHKNQDNISNNNLPNCDVLQERSKCPDVSWHVHRRCC